MNDFKNELLEYIAASPQQSVDVMFLVEKHVGDIRQPFREEEGLIKRLLNVNSIIRELDGLGWINASPKGGISTAHTGMPGFEREFRVLTMPVSLNVRLTTKGEIEYSRYKKEMQPKKDNTGINIHGDVIGSMVGSQSFESARLNPTIQKISNNTPTKPPKRSWLERTAWIVGILAALIAIWEFVIKKIAS